MRSTASQGSETLAYRQESIFCKLWSLIQLLGIQKSLNKKNDNLCVLMCQYLKLLRKVCIKNVYIVLCFANHVHYEMMLVKTRHYPPWVDTSTSNIAALWNCYFFPTSGQNTFVEASFLLNKNKFNFVSPKIIFFALFYVTIGQKSSFFVNSLLKNIKTVLLIS